MKKAIVVGVLAVAALGAFAASASVAVSPKNTVARFCYIGPFGPPLPCPTK